MKYEVDINNGKLQLRVLADIDNGESQVVAFLDHLDVDQADQLGHDLNTKRRQLMTTRRQDEATEASVRGSNR